MSPDHKGNEMPPAAVMNELVNGFVQTQIIAVAADLGVADVLHGGPMTVDQIAESVNADPQALSRVIRSLASIGIFTDNGDGTYQQNPLSETLRSDVAGSLQAFAVLYGQDWYRVPWTKLTEHVRTGNKVPFESAHGAHMFDYLMKDQIAADTFNGAMTSTTQEAESPIVEAFDFTPFDLIVDVGGGHGAMLAAVLESSPSSRGILFDLPEVVADAPSILAEKGVDDRCTVVGGSFFETVPEGGDAYLLKFILHDWNDAQAGAILNQVRKQINPEGTLLLIERGIVSENSDPDPIKFMDLHMMVMLGGLERTESEFRKLLSAAGFELSRIITTSSTRNILIEAKPS
jgi:hypothetical protein